MTYVIAWLVIGLISSVLANTYYTKDLYDEDLSNFNEKYGTIENAPSYENAKIINILTGTLFGLFTVISFYSTRSRLKKLKTK